MKNLKKWQKICLIILAVFVVIGLTKNYFIKTAVKAGASFVTGAPVSIRGFAVGIFRPRVVIKDFKLYNPKGFPKEPMVDISEVTVQYSVPDLLKGKIHLPMLVVDVEEMVIVKDKDGNMNVDALKFAQQKEEPAKETEKKAEAPKKPAKKMAIQIDEAHMDLGQVVVKDYTQGDPPLILAYNIGVNDKVYKDIKSAEEFATLIALEMMGPAGLKSAGIYAAAAILGVGFLPAGVAGVLLSSDSTTQSFKATVEEAFKQTKELLARIGEVKSEDKTKGIIKAKYFGADVTATVVEGETKQADVTVKVRKMMIPKKEIATGILYQLEGELK